MTLYIIANSRGIWEMYRFRKSSGASSYFAMQTCSEANTVNLVSEVFFFSEGLFFYIISAFVYSQLRT